jgi:polyadenylate-binding protein
VPQLSINKESDLDQKSSSKPRLIKQLPFGTEDVDVFDIFRPYGPLFSAQRILTNPQGHHTGFKGMASVVYYHEEDAQKAQSEMHCAEVEGKAISVTVDNVARRPSGQAPTFSPSAAPFVPGAMLGSQTLSASAPAFQPPQRRPSDSLTPQHPTSPYGLQGGPMMSVPGTNLQYSANGATYIDPCNLFCKNLDATIDSNYLFNLFSPYGKIVSARVMRDEKGASREFGFVSYQKPEDASRALRAMHQTTIGTKQMFVRLHEPKKVRQEKLSHKFGTSYVGNSESQNEGGPSSEVNGSSGGSRSPPLDRGVERRLSNSYFKAAASGENGGGLVDIDQLKAMSTSVRVDVVKGEFSRRVKGMKDVQEDQVDDLVSELSKMKLPDAVSALNDSNLLEERVKDIRANGRAVPIDSAQYDGTMSASRSAATERERLLQAVTDVVPLDSPVEEITDLLAGLPKKERAMALFNQEYLMKKVDEAKTMLEMSSDEEERVAAKEKSMAATPTPLTMENVAKVSSAPTNGESGESTKVYTLVELAKLPASEIIKLVNSSQSAGLPLARADPAVTKETDDFIDGLQSLPANDQKQRLGEPLFKKVRTFGIKGGQKISECCS